MIEWAHSLVSLHEAANLIAIDAVRLASTEALTPVPRANIAAARRTVCSIRAAEITPSSSGTAVRTTAAARKPATAVAR